MNIIKTSAAVLAALVATVAVNAQDQQPGVTESNTSGLISKRYVGASFSWLDVKDSSVDGFGAATVVNAPLNSLVDLHASFSHSWVESYSQINVQDLSVGATSYLVQGSAKPYVSVDVGHQWGDGDFDGFNYAVSAGCEFELSDKIALDLSASYGDGFQHDTRTDENWSGNATVTTWVCKNVALGLGVSWLEFGSVGYTAGIAYKF